MIPQRIKLKGFLCYKDEQEVGFDGASLWMLAGLNGSGKSSVFDAVTYALFGHHRGGKADAQELINKDSDRLTVEFDFTLDGAPYQIRRTLQRKAGGGASGTQMILHRQSSGSNGLGSWVPIEGASRKTEFDAWIRDHIGLNFETFTSSVLLMQGKAEKLLDSTAKGRFEVLASIVDLNRYEKLHTRAAERKKKLDNEVDGLNYRLANLPEVTTESLAEAEERIFLADTAKGEAEKEVDRLRDLEHQARQWGELQARLGKVQQQWQKALQLLADEPAIERDVNRLEELRKVLPRVQTIIEQKGEIHKSEGKTEELAKQKQKLDALLADRARDVEQSRQKRANLEARILADEQKHRDVNQRYRQVTGFLAKVKEYEQQQKDLAGLQEEMSRLPADAEMKLRSAQEECDCLTTVAQTVPSLNRLHTQREDLRKARERERSATQLKQQIQEQGKQLSGKAERLKTQLEEAVSVTRQTTEEATRLRTLLGQAEQDLQEISSLQGAKVCRHCGQNLTEGHLHEEKRRRKKEAEQASVDSKRAAGLEQAAQKKEAELRQQHTQLEQELNKARDSFREQRLLAEQAEGDIQRLQSDCSTIHSDLPEPFRAQVCATLPGDWLETTFPTSADLTALKQQAAGLPAARQRQQEAAHLVQRWNALKAQETTIAQSLARLKKELPGDPQAIHQEHLKLQTDEEALDCGLKTCRAELSATQKQLEQLTNERQQVQQQMAEVNGKLSTEEATRKLCQQALNRSLHDLPAAWQKEAENAGMKEHYGWQGELKTLVDAGTDERGKHLQQARANREPLRVELAELEQKQEQFPPEARQDPTQVQSALVQAKKTQREREDELVKARQEKATLEENKKQRQLTEEKLLEAEKELHFSKLLADLLGRDRLQLHLVRQAEMQVVAHANSVLDRLSGGQLLLRLCGEAGGDGNSAKALELEAYNRTTGEKPINVAFLSGSQKFRVAVSLALGIGQYASKQHRPIESVIIDEGFGCLDKEGRQAMIQELQNLRGHLQCILLVSHQEEFFEAFADGYRFELTDGATKVTRYQR